MPVPAPAEVVDPGVPQDNEDVLFSRPYAPAEGFHAAEIPVRITCYKVHLSPSNHQVFRRIAYTRRIANPVREKRRWAVWELGIAIS